MNNTLRHSQATGVVEKSIHDGTSFKPLFILDPYVKGTVFVSVPK